MEDAAPAVEAERPEKEADVSEASPNGAGDSKEGAAAADGEQKEPENDAARSGKEDSEKPAQDRGEGEEGDGEKKKGHSVKTLEQMMSLKEGDDERTQISKKVSWILRHGAHKVNIEIDTDGWIKFDDLLSSPIMAGVTVDKLVGMIDESNEQKVRYELQEPDADGAGQAIRAVSKHTISGMSGTVAREQRRAEREQRREIRQEQKESGIVGPPGEPGRDRVLSGMSGGARSGGPDWLGGPPGDSVRRDDFDMPKGGEKGGWKGGGSYDGPDEDGPSYEQQLKDGYRPVYQGHRVVAMVKEGSAAVKPGIRSMKGDYKGDYHKGDFKGKGDSKGYGKDDGGYGGDRGYGGYGGGYGGYGGGGYGGGYGGDRGKGDFWGKGGKDMGKGGGGYRGDRDYGGKGGDYGGKGNYGGTKGGYGGDDYSRRQYNPEPERQYWRVCPGQEAIMRANEEMASQAIMTLQSGALVFQTGEQVTNQHGIIRMPVETSEDGVRGWVTRTAEAAKGPVFFRREHVDKGSSKGHDNYNGGKRGGKDFGGKGKKGFY